MSIELDPVELGFRRPFTREVAETLRLKNPNSDPIAFKVKTTAPKKYAVRPNSGRIEGGQVVEVQVLLQALKEDPPEGEKCRDKFLVQSVAVSADQEFSNVAAIWSNIETTAKSSIQEKKIRVNWLSADGGTGAAASTPARSSLNHETPPSYGTPAGSAFSSHDLKSTASPVGPADSIDARPTGAKHLGEAKADALNPGHDDHQQQSTVGAIIASVTNAIPTSTEDLKGQLTDAQATITRLTKQVQEQGLRQRKTEAVSNDATERISAGTTGMGTQQAPPTGVPVPLVAVLCLLSFLLAYLLF